MDDDILKKLLDDLFIYKHDKVSIRGKYQLMRFKMIFMSSSNAGTFINLDYNNIKKLMILNLK